MVGLGTFYNRTTLAPISVAVLLLVGELLLILPRRFASWPLIAVMCFVPYSERVVLFGLDLSVVRICFAMAWLRLLVRAEWTSLRWARLDVAVLVYGLISILTFTLLTGTVSGFVRSAGLVFDSVGTYFLGRHLIRSWSDVDSLLRALVVCLVPVAGAMLYERISLENPFSYIYSEIPVTPRVRSGAARCRGAFPHPILAGAFVALFMPLIVTAGLRGRAGQRPIRLSCVALGLVSVGAIAILCASSTPILTIAAGLAALVAYRTRRRVLPLTLLAGGSLMLFHFMRSQPIWEVVTAMAVVEGSTADFRFRLIDAAVARMDSWWIVGTLSTETWGKGLHDITNQFILEGISGGILRLAAFVAIFVSAFAALGRSFRLHPDPAVHPARYWGLWVMLFMAVVSFNGVSYFGQNVEQLYLSLALVGSLARAPRSVGSEAIT